MSCTISMSDIWFCCTFCTARHATFNSLLKELPSYHTQEKTWFLLHDNAGFTNVTMEGGRPINEAPVSVRPIQVRDGGHITQTNIADLFCSNCGSHIGWKIISVLSQDASNHQRILFSFFF
ncbi:hypothetical protein CK203_039013 [Vitis vinifera]|uniref:Protein yippee-like n=1 Tax=Vitis vinifera TaxID=29760 RepID=A0A438DBG2_VITVI|nr:hypothetical protein CK203_099814 [Vitis vinifera]RVW85389.1 hypothetical protein CK203_039013 [Vitis vinifera]